MTRRFVVGHGALKGVPRVLTPWPLPRAANAVGGLVTDIGSLLRYAEFHMGDGTNRAGARVLSRASLTQMRSSVVPKAGTDLTMGLTWHLSRIGALNMTEHSGATNGQDALLRLVPDRRFTLAVATNSATGDRLHRDVARAAMETYFGVPPPKFTRITVSADRLQEYVGIYRRQGAEINVTVNGDALRVQITPKMPNLSGTVPPPTTPAWGFGFYDTDRALALGGPNAGEPAAAAGEFIRNAEGRVAWLRASLRLYRRGE
jgi:hypothetical protein